MIIKTLDLSAYGGIQSHVWELSQALIEQGHCVSILTSRSLGGGVRTRESAGRIIIELPKAPLYKLPFCGDLLDESRFNQQAYAWVTAHALDFDVIHLHGRSGLRIPWKNPELAGRCVWTVHGLTLQEWSHNGGRLGTYAHSRMAHWLENIAANRVNHVIAVSEDLRRQIMVNFGTDASRISVIPNGIVSRPSATVRSDDLIGFAGRLVPLKGVMLLPDLIQQLGPNIRLVIMGKGPAQDMLRRAFRRRELSDRVVWTGQLPQPGVLEWLTKIRLLVAPSYYEPQGRVVLEAMSVACPVVAGNTGGLAEMIHHGENGLLFEPGNEYDLFRNVQQLIDDPVAARSIGLNGWETSRDTYGWPRLVSQTVATYRSVREGTAFRHISGIKV